MDFSVWVQFFKFVKARKGLFCYISLSNILQISRHRLLILKIFLVFLIFRHLIHQIFEIFLNFGHFLLLFDPFLLFPSHFLNIHPFQGIFQIF